MKKILDDLRKGDVDEIVLPIWVVSAIFLVVAGVFVAFVIELPDIGGSQPPEERAAEEPAAEEPVAEELAGEELAANLVWQTGSRGSAPGQFVEPIGLVAHPSGDIYVADLENSRVQRLSAEGAFLSLWPATDGASPSLGQPSDLAVGGAGEVYVLDAMGFIHRLEPDGRLALAVPLESLQPYTPRGLAVDDVRGRFYVADTGLGRVLVVGMDGSLIDTWGPGGDDDLDFEEPTGLGLDREGNVFVLERPNSRIRKMSPDGAVVAEWKVNGAPSDLAVGPDDRVYVSAADRARLLVYDGQGKLVGQVAAPLAAASQPPGRGLAVGASGEVLMGTEGSIVKVSLQPPP